MLFPKDEMINQKLKRFFPRHLRNAHERTQIPMSRTEAPRRRRIIDLLIQLRAMTGIERVAMPKHEVIVPIRESLPYEGCW
jgi:hypothetical protein